MLQHKREFGFNENEKEDTTPLSEQDLEQPRYADK